MAKPWKKIDGDVLASTNAAISDAGGTDEDAMWVRKGRNAKRLVDWIREQRGAEEVARTISRLAMQPVSPFRGEFWNERAKAPYWEYPSDWKLNDVLAQRPLLTPHFKGLDASHVESLLGQRILLPEGMEGLLTFPKLDRLASLVSGKKGWSDINKAIGYLFGVLREAVPGFWDWTDGRIDPEYHRLSEVVARALSEDAAKTPGDFHVLPVQSGALYAGYSVRAARGHISARPREYGMACFMAACLILGSPGRLAARALVMHCPGIERAPGAGADFGRAPYFNWGDGRPGFSSCWVSSPDFDCGSASFVLPEGES